MTDRTKRDLSLERAREDAEGVEIHGDSSADRALEREREGAEGVEVFENPDATIPPSALKEGDDGEEMLSGDLFLDDDNEDEHR